MQGQPVAALVEYDGTEYAGFQLQKYGRTIQGELEQGLAAIMGEPVRVTAAGRTDAGVHARGQVVSLQAPWAHGLHDLQRAWNANLPRDIVIRALSPVAPGFNARFSACSRVYRYQIYNAPVRSALSARYTWHVERALDAQAMDRACAEIVGRRDLASFGRAPQGENTVRTVLRAHVWREGLLVCLEVEADAFLQHMMRRLVATLVAVGLGQFQAHDLAAIVRARDPRRAANLAPARGLCLMAVNYEPGALEWSLPAAELWQKESCFE